MSLVTRESVGSVGRSVGGPRSAHGPHETAWESPTMAPRGTRGAPHSHAPSPLGEGGGACVGRGRGRSRRARRADALDDGTAEVELILAGELCGLRLSWSQARGWLDRYGSLRASISSLMQVAQIARACRSECGRAKAEAET